MKENDGYHEVPYVDEPQDAPAWFGISILLVAVLFFGTTVYYLWN